MNCVTITGKYLQNCVRYCPILITRNNNNNYKSLRNTFFENVFYN